MQNYNNKPTWSVKKKKLETAGVMPTRASLIAWKPASANKSSIRSSSRAPLSLPPAPVPTTTATHMHASIHWYLSSSIGQQSAVSLFVPARQARPPPSSRPKHIFRVALLSMALPYQFSGYASFQWHSHTCYIIGYVRLFFLSSKVVYNMQKE